MKDEIKLKKYAELIMQKNQLMNLTGYKTLESIYKEGILDSIAGFNILKENGFSFKNKKLLDIGAGAGFPSIPFIINEDYDINLTIIESIKKRCDFLEYLSQNIDIKFNLINNRVEEVKSNNDRFDFITARAVANLNTLYMISNNLLKKGGYFIFPKGKNYEVEIQTLLKNYPEIKHDIQVFSYINSQNETSYMIVIKKNLPTPKGWPLKFSQIKKIS
ncbi:16S rRNA (guanine(527)-N(7))-methyltransferase RsmG [Mycoplasma sp. Mirounga ES2805-ORL]|nr:16S rRNA (guanine(527)-N(7))-methyltransferase RsmG [Mycoplasma sp. Mirounga ES2805-ORL]